MAQNSPTKSTTMAQLMSHKTPSLVSLIRGESVPGIITKLTNSEILVDIGSKTEAVVLEKDKNILHSLMSSLKVGDKVEVSILSPESEFGYPIVSLRRFIDNKLWTQISELLKDKENITVTINESTKGGFLVSTDSGISGFLPNSHLIAGDSTSDMVGKKITVNVLEINRELKKIIFSQKTTLTLKDFELSAKNLKQGETVNATVINTAPFGIFLFLPSASLTPLEGFIHQSEASWESNSDLASVFKHGQKIEAKILGLDRENKRVNLSIKRLTPDPLEEIMKGFSKDRKIKAKITRVSSSGIFLDLGDGVEGIIKKDKVPLNSTYETGQEINVTVTDVDQNRHRVILTPVLLEKPMGYR